MTIECLVTVPDLAATESEMRGAPCLATVRTGIITVECIFATPNDLLRILIAASRGLSVYDNPKLMVTAVDVESISASMLAYVMRSVEASIDGGENVH